MKQTITKLPDLVIDYTENEWCHLTIEDGVPVKMKDELTNREYRFLSSFILDILKNHEDYFSYEGFEYLPFAEYCGNEIENNDAALIETISYHINNLKNTSPGNMIPVRTDVELRKHREMLNHIHKNDHSDTFEIDRCLNEALRENNTRQFIADLFRKSENIDELDDKITNGSENLRRHMQKVEEMYWDKIRDVIRKYIKKHEKNTDQL